MCTIELNPQILEHIDKIRRHCLWSKNTEEGEKCSSLTSWEMVCQPKEKGGLGVLNLKIQNEGLLLKFLDKFFNRKDIPWVHLLWNAYYTGRNPHALDPYGSFWWRDVFKLSPIFRGISQSNVNNGKTTMFWKDLWHDAIIVDQKGRYLNEGLLSSQSLSENFHLPLSIRAMDELRELQLAVAEVSVDTSLEDSWSFAWGSDSFSSKKYYNFCFWEIQPDATFTWIWKSKCVPKLKTFCWLVFSDRLNTRNMPRRRHYVLNSRFNCLMCDNPPEETIEHMLFHCPFSVSC
jgi:hypothetical protein